jgi:hypothetical protein
MNLSSLFTYGVKERLAATQDLHFLTFIQGKNRVSQPDRDLSIFVRKMGSLGNKLNQ